MLLLFSTLVFNSWSVLCITSTELGNWWISSYRTMLFLTWYFNICSLFPIFSLPDKQFFRVLWDNLSLKFSEDQERALAEKYDLKNDGRINYRVFCEVIEQPFRPNDLRCKPTDQTKETMELYVTCSYIFLPKLSLCPVVIHV